MRLLGRQAGSWVATAVIATGCLEFDDREALRGYCIPDGATRYEICADAHVQDAGPGFLDASNDAAQPDSPMDAGASDRGGGADAGMVRISLLPSGPGGLAVEGTDEVCASPCEVLVPPHSQVQVLALPDEGARVDAWARPATCLGAEETCSFVIDSEAVVFEVIFSWQRHALQVHVSSGHGRVMGPGLSCPSACSAEYEHGTELALAARPFPGARFVRWLGDCRGSALSCNLRIDVDLIVEAEFEEVGQLVQNGQAADLVLGQLDFATTAIQPLSASSLENPNSCATDGTSVWVADNGNRRVLYWQSMPSLNGQGADLVLGQSSFDSRADRPTSRDTLRTPGAVSYANGRLYVADENRIVVWDAPPLFSGTQPQRVLGQADWNSALAPSPPSGTRFSSGAALVSSSMVISDPLNNRVLVWSHVPTTTGLVAADHVLGQADFSSADWSSPVDARSFRLPNGVAYDETTGRLAVADYMNNRVLLWTSRIAASHQPADVVLGQTSTTARSINAGLPTVNAVGINGPGAVLLSGDSLFVEDIGNRRVMVWTPVPLQTGSPATAVLGAPDLTSRGLGGATASTFNSARLCQGGQYLFVVDGRNNRVLRFTLASP